MECSREYRKGVGIVLVNSENKVFWGLRIDSVSAWQFPQGGMEVGESTEEAVFRELEEEVGLREKDVQILDKLDQPVYYTLPLSVRRAELGFLGQEQYWYLLRCVDSAKIMLDSAVSPEFSAWRWVNYATAISEIVDFKQAAYQKVFSHFEPILVKKN